MKSSILKYPIKTVVRYSKVFSLLSAIVFLSCNTSDDNEPNTNTDSCPTTQQCISRRITGDVWETKSVAEVGWRTESAVQPLLDYLELKHSKSFIILVDGKIVLENYFNGHTRQQRHGIGQVQERRSLQQLPELRRMKICLTSTTRCRNTLERAGQAKPLPRKMK